MLSEKMLAQICEDVAEIFESLDKTTDTQQIFHSGPFVRIREKVFHECPELSDKELLALLFKEYSARLRKT